MKQYNSKIEREFNDLMKKFDDVLLNKCYPLIEKEAEKIGRKYYNEFSSKLKNFEEYILRVDEKIILDKNKLEEMKSNKCELEKEIIDIQFSLRERFEKNKKNTCTMLKPAIEVLNKMIDLKANSQLKQKLTLGYKFKRQKEKIDLIPNIIINEVVRYYTLYCDLEIGNTCESIKKHEKFLLSIIPKEEKGKLEKISDYKKMNNLATDLGFEKIRQSGSHAIFSDGINTIPIPQHSLGKGISMAIQKQLSENK